MKINRDAIKARLAALEAQHPISILYACESGSRAWGFPSLDSDYDVRFIYVQDLDWYLSVEEKRDVLEAGVDDSLDLSGWEIRKCFRVLRKTNCALIEWLNSPIVYSEHSAIAPLKSLVADAFLAETACHHYLALARRRLAVIFRSETVRLKSYCYALRALLCARYIADESTPAPMQIGELLTRYLPSGALRVRIDDLLTEKSRSGEARLAARIKELDRYLQEELVHVQSRIPKNPVRLEALRFDQAFRLVLQEVGLL